MTMSDTTPVVLCIDDKDENRDPMEEHVRGAGLMFEWFRTSSQDEAYEKVEEFVDKGRLIAVICDIKLNEKEQGWKVLEHAFRIDSSLHLAAITAWGGDIPVIDLLRSGAAFLGFRVFLRNKDMNQLDEWLSGIKRTWENRELVTGDHDTKLVFDTLAPIYAKSVLPILILGESGTGKESLAKHIHDLFVQDRDTFNADPPSMHSINCGGFEPTLAFSELFGHTRNAFTDAGRHELGLILRASGYLSPEATKTVSTQKFGLLDFEEWLKAGNDDLRLVKGVYESPKAKQRAGTLFLDEVATLPPKVMAGLLRVLSSGDVYPFGYHGPSFRSYCRIIAATNEMSILEQSLTRKQDEISSFRQDLCYRLAGAVLTLSALRDRDPQVIREYCKTSVWNQIGLQRMEVSDDGINFVLNLYRNRTDDIARQYQQGNFRSLRNLMHRAALIALREGAHIVKMEHLELSLQHGRIIVGESKSNERHIRNTFRKVLQEEGVSEIDERFSYESLKHYTENARGKVAYAFLNCCLVKSASDQFYSLSEIQLALTQGMTLNAWLGKRLLAEHIREVIQTRFNDQVDTGGWPVDLSIHDMVKRLRSGKGL